MLETTLDRIVETFYPDNAVHSVSPSPEDLNRLQTQLLDDCGCLAGYHVDTEILDYLRDSPQGFEKFLETLGTIRTNTIKPIVSNIKTLIKFDGNITEPLIELLVALNGNPNYNLLRNPKYRNVKVKPTQRLELVSKCLDYLGRYYNPIFANKRFMMLLIQSSNFGIASGIRQQCYVKFLKHEYENASDITMPFIAIGIVRTLYSDYPKLPPADTRFNSCVRTPYYTLPYVDANGSCASDSVDQDLD